jgi:hypothetical protein
MGEKEAGQHAPVRVPMVRAMARLAVSLRPGLRTSKAVMGIQYPLAKPKWR